MQESAERKKRSFVVMDIVLIVLSAAFLIGLFTFLGACGAKDDGSWMTCHWAGQALKGVAAMCLLLSLVHLVIGKPAKQGADLGLIALCILAVWIPGHLIGLCMMDTMRCRAVMQPGCLIFAALIAIAALIDMLFARKSD